MVMGRCHCLVACDGFFHGDGGNAAIVLYSMAVFSHSDGHNVVAFL